MMTTTREPDVISMNRIASIGLPSLGALLALCACGPTEGPTPLAHTFDPSAGRSYVTSLEQQMAIAMGDHAMSGSRELRAGYTIRGAESNGATQRAVVRLDSVRATLIMGQSQERFDTRDLRGREFTVALPAGGGAPGYVGEAMPVIDMGERGGGALPASALIDYGLPTLPSEPVARGSTWSERRTRRQLEGTVWVSADITTTHTVAGFDTVDGSRCLVVESESKGTLSDGLAHGTAVDYVGELQASATWCFDTAGGGLVHLQGEETTRGEIESARGSASIEQTTTVTVHQVADGSGRNH